ncbi:MAG: ACT domain-containing protein [Oligosphaeraceae bacterium]|nr:ACT domain-containing protein [Oligosphaeraceae bacterium]
MKVRQLSIFLENRVGRLAGVAQLLGEAGISIRALSVADTNDFGILRLLVDDIVKAEEHLRRNNVVCRINNVTVVAVDNRPGGLAKVLTVLNQAAVNIEYMYAVAESSNQRPLLVFRFTEGEAAVAALKKADIKIINEEQLFA